jgi:hypothetical protein
MKVNIAILEAYIEEHKHVQAYIDEHHCILTRVLSERVEVDTRVGLTQNGIYLCSCSCRTASTKNPWSARWNTSASA